MACSSDPATLDTASLRLLHALRDGSARSVREISFATRLMPIHCGSLLKRLEQADWITRVPGQPCRFALRDPRGKDVAQALQDFDNTEPQRFNMPPASIRVARTCYGHFAGRLGIRITDALVETGALSRDGDDFVVADAAAPVWNALGLTPDHFVAARKPVVRGCLDWSERRPHIAGKLGKALADAAFDQGWVVRSETGRGVLLTELGARRFMETLGMRTGDLPLAPAPPRAIAG